jgi:hypothetical protein
MRLIYILFDSLNRHALGAYGGTAVPTPNFDRLAARCATFDTHYVGSLPCMPARRDLHTGRLNFLHRAWGPLEPFDNSFPEVLRAAKDTYSHLVTDHYHYFEDGGVGFHGRYSSWEFFRGQEKDKWKGVVNPPMERTRGTYHASQFDGRTDPNANMPYYVSRDAIETEEQFPIALCAASALEFLEANAKADNWLLHLECFDPHEPFFAAKRFREGLPTNYRGPRARLAEIRPARLPPGRGGGAARQLPRARGHVRRLPRPPARLDGCHRRLGRHRAHRLDRPRAATRRARILGQEPAALLRGGGPHPLFMHHPGIPAAGTRRRALTQTMDLMPTILDIFGTDIPPEVRGHSLLPVLRDDTDVREAALFGQFGGAVNVTDGRFAYLRYPEGEAADTQLHHYTLMPLHMRTFFEPKEMAGAELVGPFGFTKGMPVLKLPLVPDAAANMIHRYPLLDARTVLYDLERDPQQKAPSMRPRRPRGWPRCSPVSWPRTRRRRKPIAASA